MALLATDRLDRRLDADGDIYLGANGSEGIAGIDGVVQLAVIQLKLFLAEWFANLEEGLPWLDEVLGKKYDAELDQRIRSLVTDRMTRKVPAVTGVFGLAIEFASATRGLSISLGLHTQFGDTPADAIQASIGGGTTA